MKNQTLFSITLLSAILLGFGCSKKTEVTVEEVGPRISEGYYSTSNAEAYNVPLVSIKKESGVTYSYSFLKYECEGKTSSSYSKSGTTFSDSPVSAGGSNVTILGKKCDIKTDILAESDSTIKITVTINDELKDTYSLTKMEKQNFVDILKSLSTLSDTFMVSEETCQKSLNDTCSNLQIESKE